jgi:PAS domain S-box-containing protein
VNATFQSRISNEPFQTLARLIALSIIVVFAPVISANGADAPRVKRVLILHSFGRDFAPFNAASSGFRTELAQQSAAPIEFLEASLETARFVEGGAETPFVEYLRALFAERPADLLVPFGAPAMNFLMRHRDKLFPGVPLLVGAVDRRRLSGVNLGANATAVGVDLDLPGIIENILEILPGTTNIEVVIGNSPLEKFWLVELRRDFEPFTNRIRFNWLNELSFEAMRKHLATLPPNTAVLHAVLLVDAAGVPHEQERALEVLRRESNAPIFGAFDSQLGRGIVGGPLYPVQEVSRESARLALRILNGESPGSIETVLLGPGTPVYDWRELKRWKISENRLPPGSVIRFREPTIWEQYRWYIIAALAIIAVQTALISNLLLERGRRRRTAAVLRESEENLRRLVETTAAVPWQADVETWEFTYVGPQAVKLLGYPLEQWYQKDFWVSHLHPDDKEFAINTCLTNSERTEDFAFEYRMIASSGKIVWVHDIVKSEQRNGKPVELRGFMLDISERKQAEESLRESEERFRVMADTAPVMIWMSGPDKVCTFFNRGWLDFTGRTLQQELGNGWAEGVHRQDLNRRLDVYVNAFSGRREFTMEYRLRRYDGAYGWVLDTGLPRFEPNGTFLGYIGSCIDITERKRAAEALESQRAFLRQVIDSNPNFIFAKDREGRFTLVNRAVADVYGTTVENLIGKTDADFNPNREEVEFFQRMDLEVMDTLQERFIPEEHLTDARGQIRWLQTVKRPIVEKDGSANQVLGASTDITRRKETESELRRQRENLAHVTRISAMGELAASLAHELNQPLTAILSNAQAAQRFMATNPADLEEVHEILKDIVRDNIRASEVIRRMRALVKKENLDFSSLDLASIVREIALLVHSDAVLRNVRVSLDIIPNLPLVRGDKVQLQQVLLNLLLNAFDAMKDRPAAEREVVVRAEMNGAGTVEVAVRDRGAGLTSDKLDKIFQPFYTTKRDGLGMGLSICRSIIEAHGGRLWAQNNPDRGATFHFTVPLGKNDEAVKNKEGGPKVRPAGAPI